MKSCKCTYRPNEIRFIETVRELEVLHVIDTNVTTTLTLVRPADDLPRS